MKRIGVIILLLAFTLAPYAQKKSATKKPAAKKTAVTQTKKSGTSVKSGKSGKSGKSSKSGKSGKSGTTPQPTVKSLQNQRQQIQQEIKKQETLLRNNEKDVKKRLQNLMVLNTEIEGKRRTIDTIRKDISHLDVEIEMLMTQLEQLQDQLNERKANYVKSMRYMHRNRSVQSQMMFIFSADNLVQMFRRMRFMREYANYQRAQGEEVKEKQEEINLKSSH